MKKVKEVRGLKCPNHDYVRDNYHFLYERHIQVPDRFQVQGASSVVTRCRYTSHRSINSNRNRLK